MLFATLDTFQRNIKLSSNHEFILIDTVGFVSNLPHSLVKAFKATLEEVNYADLLLHVVDASLENHEFHRKVTEEVLKEIGAGDKDKLLVFNKIDLVDESGLADYTELQGPNSIGISAKNGTNFNALIEQIIERLYSDRVQTSLLIPYERGDILSDIRNRYSISHSEYRNEGAYVEVQLSTEDYQRYQAYRTPNGRV